MRHIYALIVITIHLLSCNQRNLFDSEEIIIRTFPENQTISGKEICIDTLGILDLFVVDTFLLTYTPMYSEYYFQIFSTTDFKHLGSFCPVGKGPNEFYAISFSKNSETINDISKIWIKNFSINYLWNITESIKRGYTVIDSTFHSKGIFTQGIWYPKNNNKIFGFVETATNIEYIRYDIKEKKELNRKSIFPHKISSKVLPIAMMEPYIKPDGTQIALIGWCSNNICIFNADFSNIKPLAIYNPTLSLNKVAELKRDDRTLFYSCSHVSNQYIYSLFINQPAKARRYHSGNEEIHIFKWNGDPVMKIVIAENIMFFTVDEKHKCLYGLTSDEKIYKYDLSEYLTVL